MTVTVDSLANRAYVSLRRRITEQSIPPGARLRVVALADQLGVSPTPVREALARLDAEGLVELVANRGYRVAPPPDTAATMQWMDARVIIEVNTLRLAAGAFQPARLDRLQRINDRIGTGRFAGDFASLRAFAELNAAFHGGLVEAAANPFLLRAWRQVALTAQFSRVHYRSGVRYRAVIAAEHQRILDALARDDVDSAAEALRRHIVDSLDRDRSDHPAEAAMPVLSGLDAQR